MPEKIPEQPTSVVPWWQDGSTTSDVIKEPYYLSKGVSAFFSLIKGWLLFPLQQSDPLTCSESLLDLMAWDRDITRFKNESLGLYRKRVKYAELNAKDSGSVAGFKRIFERLGIAIVSFKERQSEEWDICTIELTDPDISKNSALLQALIKQYGRTCRRYRFEVIFPIFAYLGAVEFSHSHALFVARTSAVCEVTVITEKINHQQQVFVAFL